MANYLTELRQEVNDPKYNHAARGMKLFQTPSNITVLRGELSRIRETDTHGVVSRFKTARSIINEKHTEIQRRRENPKKRDFLSQKSSRVETLYETQYQKINALNSKSISEFVSQKPAAVLR